MASASSAATRGQRSAGGGEWVETAKTTRSMMSLAIQRKATGWKEARSRRKMLAEARGGDVSQTMVASGGMLRRARRRSRQGGCAGGAGGCMDLLSL